MKKIINIYIIVSLILISSCAEVSSSGQSGAQAPSIIPPIAKCSDFVGQVACEAAGCEYYEAICFEIFSAVLAQEKAAKAEEQKKARIAKESAEKLEKAKIAKQIKDAQELEISNKINDKIKETIAAPVVIKNDGTVLENQDLDKISEEDFSKLSHIILPESDVLIKQITENPFANEDLVTTVRPVIYGKPLMPQKPQNGNVVLELQLSNAKKKVIDNAKLIELFGDFKKPENLLGEGGQGSVYKVTYKGEEYALKINAQEYEDLEKLQPTGAAAKVFGTFICENKPCMLMEVGQKSLEDMNKKGERLTDEQLKTAIINFKNLVEAQKKLKITNNDIKPGNLLLTKDNKLVVIDVSSSFTPGYSGSSTRLLARALIENKIGKSFKGGYIKLDRFFEFDDKDYVDNKIISPENLVHWNKIVCSKFLPNQPKCKDIENFAGFFKLMPIDKIYEMALETNEQFKDFTGTVDQTKYGPYRTGLPMPLVQELKESDWEGYYTQKDKVMNGFCGKIIVRSQEASLYKAFEAEYKDLCVYEEASKTYKLEKEFISAQDEKFKQFIKDAFYVEIYKNTFIQLAKKNPYSGKFIQEIIELNLDKTDPVDQALLDLYKS